jgi:hypothetical protein
MTNQFKKSERNQIYYKSIILTVLSMVAFYITGFAQKDSNFVVPRNYTWFGIGAGSSYIINDNPSAKSGYLNIDIGFTYLKKNKHGFQLHFTGKYASKDYKYSIRQMQSFSAMYAYNYSISRLSSFILSSGLTYNNGIYNGADTSTEINNGTPIPKFIQEPYNSVALHLAFTYVLRTPIYGFSAKIYTNLTTNAEIGLILSHNFGVLNTKRIRND